MYKKIIILCFVVCLLFNTNMVNVMCIDEGKHLKVIDDKVIYLTFDDGPSPNTNKILDILNKNNVKASFFVIGNQVEVHKDIVRRLEMDGMCILPHTNCHNYMKIYNTADDYFVDLNSCIVKIKDVILKEPVNFIRFPGGVNNELLREDVLNEIKDRFLDNKYYFVEWNVYGLDAERIPKSSDTIYNSTINQLNKKSKAIVLLHDGYGNTNTIDSLERIILYAKQLGYKFMTLDNISEKDFDYFIKKSVINKGVR